MKSVAEETAEILTSLGVARGCFSDGDIAVRTPITGEVIGNIRNISAADVNARVGAAHQAALDWRKVPAPNRGELILHFAEVLRANKEHLGRLVMMEAG
ncbi:MAG: aldehyde dehydrogenase family protein, partial [Acidobacteriaceae bacterium]|nr:aldehyde dehydrogenase family protein [Acidobacteriaceae bacterium]